MQVMTQVQVQVQVQQLTVLHRLAQPRPFEGQRPR
jgi:hypothetical protein